MKVWWRINNLYYDIKNKITLIKHKNKCWNCHEKIDYNEYWEVINNELLCQRCYEEYHGTWCENCEGYTMYGYDNEDDKLILYQCRYSLEDKERIKDYKKRLKKEKAKNKSDKDSIFLLKKHIKELKNSFKKESGLFHWKKTGYSWEWVKIRDLTGDEIEQVKRWDNWCDTSFNLCWECQGEWIRINKILSRLHWWERENK